MIKFKVRDANIIDVSSDLLLLKYAQAFYGADKTVKDKLVAANLCSIDDLRPALDDFVLIETKGVIAAKRVMFLGTFKLQNFTYDKMEKFAFRSIEKIVDMKPPIRTITTTIHGPGYGLDGGESLQRMVKGFQQGLSKYKHNIQQITFLTLGGRSAFFLKTALNECEISEGTDKRKILANNLKPAVDPQSGMIRGEPSRKDTFAKKSESTETKNKSKRRIFVAMPFSDEFENVYDFGIYPAVRNSGCICERVDETHFTGDVLDRIREGIENADLVIADLTGGRPNVYLEVGYAWGRSVPVIFVARNGEELHFDVRTHRCIYYGKFKKFANELEALIRGIFNSTLK